MIKKLLLISALSSGINSFSQCLTSSIPTKTCSSGDQIEAFTLNSVAATGNSGCGTSGYSSSSQTWTLALGQSYAYSSTTGATAVFPQAFAIFIDLNGDNQYSPSEMVKNDPLGYTHNGSITIPYNGSTLGSKKMRIICNESALNSAMACDGGLDPYGEVEDYNVVLICPTITPSIVGPPTLCTNNTATLTVSSPGATFTWTPGGANTNSLVISTSASVAAIESYTLLTDIPTCSTYTVVYSVSVAPNPTVSISGSNVICPGSNATTLTASGASNYTWTGASPSNSNTLVVSPSNAGTTLISLSGSTGFCSANSATLNIIKTSTASLTPTVNPVSTTLCSNQTKTLTAGITTTLTLVGNSYSWSPGSSTSNTIAISSSATTTGVDSYTVYTGYSGCPSTYTNSAVVNVSVAPTPSVSVSGISLICATAPTTVNLSANGASSYTWNTTATTATVDVAPPSTTIYTVTGQTGFCLNVATFKVTKAVVLSPSISGGTLLCGATSTILSGNNLGDTYTWSPGGQVTNTISILSTGATTSVDVYTISTGFAGCPSTFTATTYSVISAPIPTLSVSGNTLLCKPAINSTSLTASGASNYVWSNGFNSTNVYLSPTVTTVYSFTGTTGYCFSTKTVSVLVSAVPVTTISSSSPSVCVGQTATITANGGLTYLWNSGSTSPSIVITPTVTGNYTVMVTITNSVGCSLSTVVTEASVNCTMGFEELGINKVTLYPNPMNNFLTININESLINKTNIEIYDALGKLVIKENLIEVTNTINVSYLNDGIYLYKVVKGENPIKMGKIIKN